MVSRKGKGSRRKSSHKLSKSVRERGKIEIRYILQEFSKGDRVVIKIDPSFHKGLPHPRFYGKVGEVIDKRGDCYEIKINDGNKEKILIVHPAHLRKI